MVKSSEDFEKKESTNILSNDYDMNHIGLNDNLTQVTDIITSVRYENLEQQRWNNIIIKSW